jgi:hypothetical protein
MKCHHSRSPQIDRLNQFVCAIKSEQLCIAWLLLIPSFKIWLESKLKLFCKLFVGIKSLFGKKRMDRGCNGRVALPWGALFGTTIFIRSSLYVIPKGRQSLDAKRLIAVDVSPECMNSNQPCLLPGLTNAEMIFTPHKPWSPFPVSMGNMSYHSKI